MASVDSILRSILRGGQGMRQMDEPKWSKEAKRRRGLLGGLTESGIAALQTFGNIKQQDQVNYAREQATLKTFESRLNNPINSAFADSTIYSNKTLDEVEATMGRMHSEDIRRFPNQQADFTDVYESQSAQLNKYRSLNNNYNYLSSKIPDSKKFLEDMTNKLSTTSWEELTPEAKLQIKNELTEGTQNIATLGKMIANNQDYFKNHETFNRDADDIQIGIIGGYNQLLTQIDTFDPDGNVISKADLGAMLRTIRENRPEDMKKINEINVGFKTARVTGNAREFDKAHIDWKNLDQIHKSLAYENAWNEKLEAYKELDDAGKRQANSDPEYWKDYTLDPSKAEGINLFTIKTDLEALENQMDTIDADYVQDTGGEYSKWRGRATPWRMTEEELEAGRKTKLKEDIIKKTGVAGLPSVGGGETVVAEGDEPFGVSELHKPVTPTEPTMPTSESREFVEWNNPGNLKFANQTDATGKTPTGFATFDTPDAGWQALYNQIEADKGRNDTLKQFIYGKGDDDYGYTATDREPYLKNLSQELNLSPNAKIDTVSTKELANAIAKQEGWKGDFPETEVDEYTLYKTDNGKPVVSSTSKPFIKAQSNLSSIVSDKFSKLSASGKSKYKGSKKEATRQFVKDQFEKWLRESGKYGKPYAEGDYKYFFPTKTENNKTWYPGAFKRAPLRAQPTDLSSLEYAKERIELIYSPDVVATDAGYAKFAKDFDAFRKYLQES